MAERQAGKAVVYGLGTASIATNVGVGFSVSADQWNVSDVEITDEQKQDQIPSQAGDTIETYIISQRVRRITLNFHPKSTTRTLAIAQCQEWLTLSPLVILKFSGFILDVLNQAAGYTYMGGATMKGSRESWWAGNISLMAKEDPGTPGTFIPLAEVTG